MAGMEQGDSRRGAVKILAKDLVSGVRKLAEGILPEDAWQARMAKPASAACPYFGLEVAAPNGPLSGCLWPSAGPCAQGQGEDDQRQGHAQLGADADPDADL